MAFTVPSFANVLQPKPTTVGYRGPGVSGPLATKINPFLNQFRPTQNVWGTPEEVAAGTAQQMHKPGGPGKRRGLFGRIGKAAANQGELFTTYEGRKALGLAGAVVGGGVLAAGGLAGAGAAGAGAGTGAGLGAAEGAAFIDPFLAGGGAGMAGWAPIAGGAAAAGAGAGAGVASGTGGAYGPYGVGPALGSGGGGAGGGFWGSLAKGALGGGGGGNMWGQILGQAGSALLGNYLNNRGDKSGQMSRIATAPFTSGTVQELLPPYLQYGSPATQGIDAGLKSIGQMIQNPGQLAPGVAEAIAPRLAAESQSIGTNYRGLQEENAGAAARTNAPVSLKNAISAALGMGQERAQREARMSALTESDQLRRQDLQQTYALIDAILQHLSSARGQAITGLGAAQNQNNQQNAALMAFLGQLANSNWPSYMGQNPGPG